MGLICNESGKHKAALEHFMRARKSFRSSGDKTEGFVETSIGDTFVSLGYHDKAVSAYQKALTTFKKYSINTMDSCVDIASVYVSLAGVYMRLGKVQESRGCCETALQIYAKNGVKDEVVAGALTEIATIYEAQDEHNAAVSLLKKAICMLAPIPGRTNVVAGVEAQIGIIEYLHRNYGDAHSFLSKAAFKLRASGRGDSSSSSLLGMVLNHMGLVYIQLADVQQAVRMFEESKDILEAVYGSHHPETLSVYSNLAGAYDALGR
jgi:tetratricopeptide (TPR) repeat protein